VSGTSTDGREELVTLLQFLREGDRPGLIALPDRSAIYRKSPMISGNVA
jgi:hypothetical protein